MANEGTRRAQRSPRQQVILRTLSEWNEGRPNAFQRCHSLVRVHLFARPYATRKREALGTYSQGVRPRVQVSRPGACEKVAVNLQL